MCPFVHCAFLIAMETPVRKTFTTDVGQMQRRRHHMTARAVICGLVFSTSFVAVQSAIFCTVVEIHTTHTDSADIVVVISQ